MNDKEIRFIDSNYRELFRIPDGGKINITLNNGEQLIKECKYHDDYHFELRNEGKIFGNVYHICEFAEIMERNGNTYEPVQENTYQLDVPEADEKEFVYGNREHSERGCIGRLRGDFGTDGDRFYSTWEDESGELKTDEFHTELDELINHFRLNSDTPVLKSLSDMARVCSMRDSLKLDGSWTDMYMFKVRTEKHTHYIRCCPVKGDYNFYVYSYDNKQLDRYRDVKFVEQTYGTITEDKFFKTDGGITEVYYNPDANSGGQLVYIEASDDIIREAAEQFKKPMDFFSHIEGMGRGYLIDVGTPEFRGNLKSFMNRKADFEGCTKKTMDGLKKAVGIMPTKSRKHSDMER